VNRIKEGFRIAQVLSQNGHSVISNESLLISASPKVKLILNVLKYITAPEDKIAQL
jgi:ATP-dependent exoDNAse (exonuclease V) beta subunit